MDIQSKTREEELVYKPPEELAQCSNELDILRESLTATKDAAKKNEEDLVWENSKEIQAKVEAHAIEIEDMNKYMEQYSNELFVLKKSIDETGVNLKAEETDHAQNDVNDLATVQDLEKLKTCLVDAEENFKEEKDELIRHHFEEIHMKELEYNAKIDSLNESLTQCKNKISALQESARTGSNLEQQEVNSLKCFTSLA